jgi:uncharacterized protein (TIGR03083 family)
LPVPDRPDAPTFDAWLDALEASHRRLVDVVSGLSGEQVVGPSYDTEWSIAQVLSHLGSGAELFSLFVQAGLAGEPAPGMDRFQPVWDKWDAKVPTRQATEALAEDRSFLDHLQGLDAEQRSSWAMSMFGTDRTLTDLVMMRLGEHALHTWDVAVIPDPSTVVAPDAVALLIDTQVPLVERLARPVEQPLRVHVVTQQPGRHFLLAGDADPVQLRALGDETEARGDPVLDLPSEAFIRLISGRLDREHTPPLAHTGVVLDDLRRLFPGF